MVASAQQQADWFPFYFPFPDTLPAETLSFLPIYPQATAGSHGFLQVGSDGHFQFEDGTPVRFVGVNFSFGASFPDTVLARAIAKRLRKFGVNIVRLHHMDAYRPFEERETIFDLSTGTTRKLNPDQLFRLDYFIDALAREGIYVDLNLHVSRVFQPGDGLPDPNLPLFGKLVTLFEPRLIFLQKEYARNLLEHHNPFTGLRYVDDPRIALIEITNENSLIAAWRLDALNHDPGIWYSLSPYYSGRLDTLWQQFLQHKYGSTESLRAAWSEGAGGSGADLVRNGDFETPLAGEWRLEVLPPAQAHFERRIDPGGGVALVDVNTPAPERWRVQLRQIGFSLDPDSVYTVSFRARASKTRRISVIVMQETEPWANLGLAAEATLTSDWQRFTFAFRPKSSPPADVRLSFSVGDDTTAVWLDDVALRSAEVTGLARNESLEAGTVRRILYGERLSVSRARRYDLVAFYETTQRRFFSQMLTYLHDSLGVRVPVAGSNIYGGLADVKSNSVGDYVDNHAYWDHPQFPGIPWSPTDWFIDNRAMVRQTPGSTGTLARLAAAAVADKPFTVSEYNHPFPNRYQAEAPLFLAAFASLQDWDGIFLYSFHHGHDDWERRAINPYFDIDAHPVMMALLPQMAEIFRQRLLSPAVQQVSLQFTSEDVHLYDETITGILGVPGELPESIVLKHRLRVGTFDSPRQYRAGDYGIVATPPPYRSDTGEIIWDTEAGLLTARSPYVEAATGFLDQQPVEVARLRITSASTFGTVLWSSVTPQPLSDTRRSLLSVVTRTENTGMRWDGDRTVHDNWGTAPTLVEPQVIDLELSLPVDSLVVSPLDSLGRPLPGWSVTSDADGKIRLHIDQRQWPALWFGLRHALRTTAVTTQPQSVPERFALHPSYPNPFQATGSGAAFHIPFDLPQPARVRVTLFNVRGQRVAQILDRGLPAGRHRLAWSPDPASFRLASGIYFYRVEALSAERALWRGSGKVVLVK